MKLDRKTCFLVAVSIFLLYLAIHHWPSVVRLGGLLLGAAKPLLVGGGIAYIINILMSFYEQRYFKSSTNPRVIRSRRPVCMLAAFATLLAVSVLVVYLVVPQLVDCVRLCAELVTAELPGILRQTTLWIDKLDILPEDITATLTGIDWQAKLGQLVETLTAGIGDVMAVLVSAASSVVSVVVAAVLGFIFSIYLLLGKENLQRQFSLLANRFLKPRHKQRLSHLLKTANECFHKYIVGQCMEAVILGCLCTLGMLLLQLPYAAMIGALIAFTALIPVAGAYIGGGIGAFMILTVSPVKAIIFLVFLVILQQIEGNVIYPKVVGTSMGLPAIWVLAAVTIGGGVMGVLGMLLGVPAAAVIYRLLKEAVHETGAEGS